MSGHVFVVQSDLLKLACDDLLLPTDVDGNVTMAWTQFGEFQRPDGWGDDGVRVSEPAASKDAGPRVRWVNTGSDIKLADIAWLRAGVRQALDAVGSGETASTLPGRAKRLVGMPVFGTGAGGFDKIRGAALDGLLDECRQAATTYDVDIALTCWHRADYVALQSRRVRSADSHPALSERLSGHADRLGELLANRQVALFLGAGISIPAGLPAWPKLIEQLADMSSSFRGHAAELGNLAAPDAAMLLQQEDPQAFRKNLTQLLTVPRHAIGHALLASLQPPEVITTNFDALFEQAAQRPFERRTLTVLPKHRGTVGEPWLLKMHGDIDDEHIVLSRDEFLGYDAMWRPLASMMQSSMLTRHMIFVGYSLADENFIRLGRDVSRLLRRMSQKGTVGTVLTLAPNPFRSKLWGDDLEEIAMAPVESDGACVLEMFLDRLAMTAAAGESSYLLDSRYIDLVDADDRALVRELVQVGEKLRDKMGSRWGALKRTFGEHGLL